MATPKIDYVVTLSKKFIYPKSVLEKGYEIQNAKDNAHQDIYTILREIVHNKYEDINIDNIFVTSVVEDTKVVKKPTESYSKKEITIDEAIEFLSIQDLEKKYGIIAPEENPELYDFVGTEEKEAWALKNSIHTELEKIRGKYFKLFKGLINKIEIKKSLENPGSNNRRNRRDNQVNNTPGRGSGITWQTLNMTSPTIVTIDPTRSTR